MSSKDIPEIFPEPRRKLVAIPDAFRETISQLRHFWLLQTETRTERAWLKARTEGNPSPTCFHIPTILPISTFEFLDKDPRPVSFDLRNFADMENPQIVLSDWKRKLNDYGISPSNDTSYSVILGDDSAGYFDWKAPIRQPLLNQYYTYLRFLVRPKGIDDVNATVAEAMNTGTWAIQL